MKNLVNLGKLLSKKEQKVIFAGLYIAADTCSKNSDCGSGVCATFETQIGRYPPGRHCL